MVHQDMALADELVHGNEFDGLDNATANALHDDLGGFANIDDLEDFLRGFEASDEDEASFATQGDSDVGGDPIDTVH